MCWPHITALQLPRQPPCRGRTWRDCSCSCSHPWPLQQAATATRCAASMRWHALLLCRRHQALLQRTPTQHATTRTCWLSPAGSMTALLPCFNCTTLPSCVAASVPCRTFWCHRPGTHGTACVRWQASTRCCRRWARPPTTPAQHATLRTCCCACWAARCCSPSAATCCATWQRSWRKPLLQLPRRQAAGAARAARRCWCCRSS